MVRHWRAEMSEWIREDLRSNFVFSSYDQFSGDDWPLLALDYREMEASSRTVSDLLQTGWVEVASETSADEADLLLPLDAH